MLTSRKNRFIIDEDTLKKMYMKEIVPCKRSPDEVINYLSKVMTNIDITEVDPVSQGYVSQVKENSFLLLKEKLNVRVDMDGFVTDYMKLKIYRVERITDTEAFYKSHLLKNPYNGPLYVFYEESTGYMCSNDSLFDFKLRLLKGISQEEINEEGQELINYLNGLHIYNVMKEDIKSPNKLNNSRVITIILLGVLAGIIVSLLLLRLRYK